MMGAHHFSDSPVSQAGRFYKRALIGRNNALVIDFILRKLIEFRFFPIFRNTSLYDVI